MRTIAAEDILHDLGAICRDELWILKLMGRVAEAALRTWQKMPIQMKLQRGPLDGDSMDADNNRIECYVAKYTINPATAHGISHGSWLH